MAQYPDLVLEEQTMFIDHPHIHFARLLEERGRDGTPARILVLETDIMLAPAQKLHADDCSENLVGYLEYLHRLKDEGFIECDAIAVRDINGRTYMHCKPQT